MLTRLWGCQRAHPIVQTWLYGRLVWELASHFDEL
jgi:hypothetical protein